MLAMPSSRSRRRVEIPAAQYERLKAIADAEERTVASVAAELLGGALKVYQPLPPPTDQGVQYTPRAQRVLELAWNDEPARLHHNYVGTEHILLGLLAEGDGLAAGVLRELGVRLVTVREAVDFMIGRGPREGEVTRADGTSVRHRVLANPAIAATPRRETPRVRRVLALATEEARNLDHGFVGTGHLLLGLMREGEGIAAGILESLGVEPDRARDAAVAAFGRHDMPLSQS